MDFFGFQVPSITVPQITLPKVTVPTITPPKISLPSVPKVELPQVKIPAVPLPKADGPKSGYKPGLTKRIGSSSPASSGAPDAAGMVSGGIDAFVNARDRSYETAGQRLASGDVAAGGLQLGATMAADMVLPTDAVNVTNKILTGRGDTLTSEDYLWAAVDAIGLAAAPFTLGASFAATRALKLAKTTKGIKAGAEMSKLSGFTKALRGVSSAAKSTSSLGALKAAQAARAAKAAQYAKQINAAKAAAAAKSAAKVAQTKAANLLSSLKITRDTKALSAIGDTKGGVTFINYAKSADAAKTSKIGSALKYGGLGAGLGVIGMSALGLGAGDGGDEYPYEPDAYDPYADPWAGLDLGGEGIYGTGEDYLSGGYPYVDAAYPDLLGLEGGAQDLLAGMEDIPLVGDAAEAARMNGLALPFLVVGGLVVAGGAVYFLKKTKTGKQITTKVSGAVKGAGKAVKGAV